MKILRQTDLETPVKV